MIYGSSVSQQPITRHIKLPVQPSKKAKALSAISLHTNNCGFHGSSHQQPHGSSEFIISTLGKWTMCILYTNSHLIQLTRLRNSGRLDDYSWRAFHLIAKLIRTILEFCLKSTFNQQCNTYPTLAKLRREHNVNCCHLAKWYMKVLLRFIGERASLSLEGRVAVESFWIIDSLGGETIYRSAFQVDARHLNVN